MKKGKGEKVKFPTTLMTNSYKYIIFAATCAIFLLATAIFSQTTLPPPKQEKLLNGLKVLMWSDAKADKVSVKIRIHSGSAFDPQGKEGLMQILADNFFPNESIRDFFKEDLGGDLEVITNYDYMQVNTSASPEHFLTMLEAVATAVSNPAIDKETTARLRAALLAKITTLEGDPSYVADQTVARRLFGTFPYGRPQFGTADSLKKIEFGDLIDAKNRFLTADNATIAISGNFDKSSGFRAVRRYFGSWLKADKKIPATFRQSEEFNSTPLQIEMSDLTKSYFRSAKNAPGRSDREYRPMQMLAGILDHCPDKFKYQANLLRGIYVVNSDTNFGDLPICLFIKKSGGRPEIRQDAFDAVKAKSLAAAQDQSALADLWLDVETYKLTSPDDEIRKINAVTLADVKTMAEKLTNSPSVQVFINIPIKERPKN